MEKLIKIRKKNLKGFQEQDWPENYLEKIFCPLCQSINFKRLYPKSYKRIVACKSCNLIYSNPRLKKKYLKHLYSREYFNNNQSSRFGYQDYLGDKIKILKTFSKHIEVINKIMVKKGRLLDVGCATGFFLKVAEDKKWKVEGVEISDFGVNYVKKHFKFKIYKRDFLDLNLPKNYFDVVTMWDVIEHFYEPEAALLKVNKLLKSEGLLVVSTPDVESLPAKLTKDRWVGYKLSDEHLTYFSKKTIHKLLQKTGFTIIKQSYVGKYVSLPMLADRISLYNCFLGKVFSFASKIFPRNYYLYVNPFDIMCIYAKKTSELGFTKQGF